MKPGDLSEFMKTSTEKGRAAAGLALSGSGLLGAGIGGLIHKTHPGVRFATKYGIPVPVKSRLKAFGKGGAVGLLAGLPLAYFAHANRRET